MKMFQMEVTEPEALLLQELRTIQAANKDATVHTAMFAGDDDFARFIHSFIEQAREAEDQKIDGKMFAWAVKAAYNGQYRKAQHKFMTQALAQVLGPKEWDLSTDRRSDETTIVQ